MKKLALCMLFILVLAYPFRVIATQVNLGVSLGEEGLRGFYLAIGEYYRVPEREVIIVKERHIPDEELPVVFFISTRARVSPFAVIDLRLAGRSWMDISLHFGLGPEVYYVPVKVEVKGPPYGKAYGYYKNKPRKEWAKIVPTDADVINLVNLRFVSEHYHYPPDHVIRMRSGGKGFVVIHDEVKKAKGKHAPGAPGKKGKGIEVEKGGGKGKGKK